MLDLGKNSPPTEVLAMPIYSKNSKPTAIKWHRMNLSKLSNCHSMILGPLGVKVDAPIFRGRGF